MLKARIGLLGLAVTLFMALQAQAPIDPLLQSRWQSGQVKQEAWLVLEQAQLQAPQGSQLEKGAYVFQALREQAEREQARLLPHLQAEGLKFRPYYLVNAVYLPELRAEQAAALAARPEIKAILPNLALAQPDYQPLQPTVFRNASFGLWGLERVEAKALWALGIKGQGVSIGGQDTGYDPTHPALSHSYRGREQGHAYNWHDAIHEPSPLHLNPNNPCGFDVLEPCDDGEHGTHTMGTMAGLGADSIGVAPLADWVGCRNMDRGWGSPATYIECFEWFLAPTDLQAQNPRPDRAPQVINNSWGCPPVEGCYPSNFELMRLAVHNLRQAGVIVVVSAGNGGPDCHTVNSPAAIFDEVFSVGASDPEGRVTSFSSRGTVLADSSARLKPDVVAPGQAVWSSIPGNGYRLSSGTSMAGPHVAGVVALLISAEPSLAGQVERIEELLRASASPLFSDQECGGISGRAQPNPISGYGQVNALKALQLLRPDLMGFELDERRLVLSPNPSNGRMQLVCPEDFKQGSLRIFNYLGQLMHSQDLSFIRLYAADFSFLPSGHYIIQLCQEGSGRCWTGKWYRR